MDSENVDTTQQVTSKVPSPQVVKNPKRVAAGKAIAEKRRQAREAQKQKIAEADIIIANERLKKAQEEAKKVDVSPPAATPSATPDTATPDTATPDTATPDTATPHTATPDTATPKETVSQILTTTQWLMVITIGVSMVSVYYKREEIKNCLSKIKASAKPAPESTPAPVNKTPKKVGIRTMD